MSHFKSYNSVLANVLCCALVTCLGLHTGSSVADAVTCEQCTGPLCGVVPGTPTECPRADTPYCMNTIRNSPSGQKTITKACVTATECETKWWHGSYSDGQCANFDINSLYPFDFTCNFCCILSGCNTDAHPRRESLYGIATTTAPLPTTPTTTTTPGPTYASYTPVDPVKCEVCNGPLCGVVPNTPTICPADKPYCMNTVNNTADGSKIITKECATIRDCDVKWWHGSYRNGNCAHWDVNKVYPFPFVCNFCCVEPECNTDTHPQEHTLYGIHPTTTAGPTLPLEWQTVPAAGPVSCETCSGPLCGVVPGQSTKCPRNKPYCMNSIENTATGSKVITKSCSSVYECDVKWWHESAGVGNCQKFTPADLYPFAFTCHYCCVTPGCNQDVVPDHYSLYGFYTTTTTTPAPVLCDSCSGPLCGVVPSSDRAKCWEPTPLCMNTVENKPDGSKVITKGCASTADCIIKWSHGSSRDATCTSFDQTSMYPFQFTCNYCCTGSDCNVDVFPAHDTLYVEGTPVVG